MSLHSIDSNPTASLAQSHQGSPIKRTAMVALEPHISDHFDSADVNGIPSAIWEALHALPDIRTQKVADAVKQLEVTPHQNLIDGFTRLIGVQKESPILF